MDKESPLTFVRRHEMADKFLTFNEPKKWCCNKLCTFPNNILIYEAFLWKKQIPNDIG